MIGLATMLVGVATSTFTLAKADIRTISRHCHAPAHWIVVRPDKSAHLRPPANAPYNKVDCLARALRKRGGPVAYVGKITS